LHVGAHGNGELGKPGEPVLFLHLHKASGAAYKTLPRAISAGSRIRPGTSSVE
jgi:hypothetical protein